MKKFLKIFLAALALAAAVSLFVISIGASEAKPEMASYTNSQGETVESDFLSAIKEAKPGTTVTLLGNCNQITSAAIDKDLTVDLGGYSLSTTKSITLFNVKESVNFTITGTGSINATGMVYETVSGKTPTVSIVGSSGKGIKITQNNTSSTPYIVHNYNGTYLFKNLDVVTNFSAATTRYQSFFHNDTDTTSATVTFDTVEFNAPNAKPNNPGTFILGVCGSNSKLVIKNSGLYSNASGIYLGHLAAPDNVTANGVGVETVIVDITDSVVSNGGTAHNAKSYGLFLEREGFGSSGGAIGVINVKNSVLESAGRAIYDSVNSITDTTKQKVIVNFVNSTLRGKAYTGTNADFVLSRHTIVNLDATSKVSTFKYDVNFAADYGAVKGSVGTRTNVLETTKGSKSILFPDGTNGT
ncbi:MAG: hypothetical protein J6R35_03315 [Clostridia bacterium]|nr:hypothetical protein [Clostridia bacterium]